MANNSLPPAPIRDPWGSYTWEEWFRRLRDRAMAGLTSVLWSAIDFTGSNLTSILTRNHNDLQNIQGGTSAEYYHLTSAQYSAFGAGYAVTTVSVNTSMNDTYHTYVVDTSAVVMTLPAASTARIGQQWAVVQDVVGTVTVQRAGSDTIILPTSDTSVIIANKGDSVTFRCVTATKWAIV